MNAIAEYKLKQLTGHVAYCKMVVTYTEKEYEKAKKDLAKAEEMLKDYTKHYWRFDYEG